MPSECKIGTTLWLLCRLFGVIQYPEVNQGRIKNFLLQVIFLPINIFYFMCIYTILFNEIKDYTSVFQKIKAGGLVSTLLLHIGKLFWYRSKRFELRKLIKGAKMLGKSDEINTSASNKLDRHNLGLLMLFMYMLGSDIVIMSMEPISVTIVSRHIVFSIPTYFIYIECAYLGLFLKHFYEQYYYINNAFKDMVKTKTILIENFDKKNDMQVLQRENLSFVHYDVTSLSNEASELFSFPFVYNHQTFLFNVICISQYLLVLVTSEITLDTAFRMGRTLNSLLFYFWTFFIVIGMWNKVEKEGNKTATYVHEIWNSLKWERNGNRHLKLLSTRLLCTKIEFTANNYLRLNWSFFLEILDSFLMYASLVLQMKT